MEQSAAAVRSKMIVSPQVSRESRLNQLKFDLSLKFGIDFNNTEKHQYLLARNNQEKKHEIVRIDRGSLDYKEPFVTINGQTKSLMDVAFSGDYSFVKPAKEIETAREAISKELSKGNEKVYVAAMDQEKVKNVAVFEREPETKNVLITEINGKKPFDPAVRDQYNFVENAVKNFHKCVFFTKDEYERSRVVGEEISISKERPSLTKEKSPERALDR
ncbi:hypothetical protein [Cytobacillus gottheilii]|uniref:Uncharacterized protein n=1 Tax=Cytobacillus gottheilii TaxID=859144 RepID=A0ABX8FIZ5_9BACI|nr:hypothetical protein [Cytobacillus gottheilii]QVY63973.1 hypothetical protein J1899_22305 [Cytobacillus gottheilii]